eukprot:Skav208139  [mRNA]  locus=scaffold4906:7610:7954:- [translate_table: standard]
MTWRSKSTPTQGSIHPLETSSCVSSQADWSISVQASLSKEFTTARFKPGAEAASCSTVISGRRTLGSNTPEACDQPDKGNPMKTSFMTLLSGYPKSSNISFIKRIFLSWRMFLR